MEKPRKGTDLITEHTALMRPSRTRTSHVVPIVAVLLSCALYALEPTVALLFNEGEGDQARSSVGTITARMGAQWAKGAFGSAVFFGEEPGLSVTLPDGDAVRFGTGGVALSCWVCPTRLPDDPERQYQRLLSKSSFPGTFWVLDTLEDGRVTFAMRDDEGHTGTTQSKGALAEGRWTHLAVAVDREACTTRYYFDGSLDSEQSFTDLFSGRLDVPGQPLHISTWRPFTGLVDNLRLYHVSPAPEHIRQEFQRERGGYADAAFTAVPKPRMDLSVPVPTTERQSMWDLTALSRTPATYPAPQLAEEEEPGVRALFYEGLPLNGQPTRVFAWYGTPAEAEKKRLPGMVLVHGGGGTAFKSWVNLWVGRGYAAIAMDTCGGIPIHPEGQTKGWKRHEHSGPNGWGDFERIDEPPHDQWTYHAVGAVVLGHSLLRSLPEVDPGRIGLTGISWGGYLTNIVAGVDPRFRFAVPVYGCGFLGENSAWAGRLQALGQERGLAWVRQWDPSQYVCFARLPMLFCNGTNDVYPMDSWQKTYRTAKGTRTLCCKIRMPHSHPPAGDPPEVTAFADHILEGDSTLVRITGQGRQDRSVWTTYDSVVPVVRAELCYTVAEGDWKKRTWETTEAVLETEARRARAELPAGTTVYFLNLVDERGLTVSTEHEELPHPEIDPTGR